jgi:hypothetical protein
MITFHLDSEILVTICGLMPSKRVCVMRGNGDGFLVVDISGSMANSDVLMRSVLDQVGERATFEDVFALAVSDERKRGGNVKCFEIE